MTSTVCADFESACFCRLAERRPCAPAGEQVRAMNPTTRRTFAPHTPLSSNVIDCVPFETSCYDSGELSPGVLSNLMPDHDGLLSSRDETRTRCEPPMVRIVWSLPSRMRL